MNRGNLSRRGFVRRSLALLTGGGLPLWYGQRLLAGEEEREAATPQSVSPNDRINLGVIGIGSPKSRGLAVTKAALKCKGVGIVAVCDVDRAHRQRATKEIGSDCAQYSDFRELLERKDIDAVIIATPDHWHAIMAIAALKKGKDVYCEKPLALTIAEGRAVVNVARATDRVFQVGSQQRCDPRFRLAAELVRNDRMGRIRTIETMIGANPRGGPFKVQAVPDGLDWDFWLGPAPKVDYVTERCHYEYRWWSEYSGGKLTDWGAHHNDIAQWALNMDGSGPLSLEATGEEPSKEPNSYNCHPTFKVTYTYPKTKLICTSEENGVRFKGRQGRWLFVNRQKIEASDSKLLDEPLPKNGEYFDATGDHMTNFIECIRSRERPICDVEIGHRSATVCHLGNIALRVGKKLTWDPVQEQFDHAEANKLLTRDMRGPWKLDI